VAAFVVAVGAGAAAVLVSHHTSKNAGVLSPGRTPTVPAASFPTGTTIRPVPGSDVALPLPPTGGNAEAPSSISTNCAVDVTSALQSWINATPDDSTLTFQRNACYRVDGTLRFKHRDRLRLDGNGATLRAMTTGARTRSQLLLQTSSNITVQDLIVRGANPHAGATKAAYVARLEAQHAFDVQGSLGVMLLRVQAYDLYGDFVYIGAGERRPSENVTVYNSSFERSGRQGISVTAGVNVAIVDDHLGAVARSMFDLEANSISASIRHILIVGNTTGPALNFWLANKGRDANIGDIRFIRNRMVGATRGLVFVYSSGVATRGPYLFESNDLIASGQLGDEGSKGAFFFANARDVVLRDNTVKFAPEMLAIELRNTHHLTVSGNRFEGQGTLLLPTEGSSDYHVS
jgi:hypothetical protein